MKDALYISGEIVHSLQRERGCTSIFLYSEGKIFSSHMQEQFKFSDKAIGDALKWFEENQSQLSDNPNIFNKFNTLFKAYIDIGEFRNKILNQDISVSDSIGYYSHQLIGPLIQQMVEFALYMEGSNPARVSAYNAFLQWKERIGLERAIGARGFVGYSFQNREFVERIFFLLSEQKNYKNTYLALTSERQKKLLLTSLENCEECVKLNELHDAIENNPECEMLYNITPEDWFELISIKIDVLHGVENNLVDSLIDAPKEIYPPSHETPPSIQADCNLGVYKELINSLQLFSGLDQDVKNSLLSRSQIREYEKCKLLFLEGEQAGRLYIILKGWVKLFKGTMNGEETILQMLSAGDTIMESAILLNTQFPVSAQIVEDATLLSIPAPVLRELIKKNNELALNFLATMSHRSQLLIRQIENTRLKTVDERIGWFLLKQLLNQGRKSRQVELPYYKSLIASYLDMKRETFSRSLNRMKEKGFQIESDKIVIPSLSSLCEYCDSDVKLECMHHKTPLCPQSEKSISNIAL